MVKVNNKKKCGECSREVVDLPRHMRLVHKWSLYKDKLSEGFLVKDKLFPESIKEIRAARERDKI